MLHQKPSGNLARLKYLAVLPLCTAMLCISTLSISKSYGYFNLAPAHKGIVPPTANNPETAPSNSAAPSATDSIYTRVDKQPDFPGGLTAFYKYLGKTIKYPSGARQKGIQGKVVLQFIVKKDGSIANVKVVRKVSPDIDREAARAIGISPKWRPGLIKGKPVNCQFNVPVSFTLVP